MERKVNSWSGHPLEHLLEAVPTHVKEVAIAFGPKFDLTQEIFSKEDAQMLDKLNISTETTE